MSKERTMSSYIFLLARYHFMNVFISTFNRDIIRDRKKFVKSKQTALRKKKNTRWKRPLAFSTSCFSFFGEQFVLYTHLIQLLKLQVQVVGGLPQRGEGLAHIAGGAGREIALRRQVFEGLVDVQEFLLLRGQGIAQQISLRVCHPFL